MANKQTIVFDIQAEISQVKKSAQEMRNIFEKMDLSDPLRKSFSGTFTKLERELRNIEVIANKGLSSLSDTKKAETSIEKINDLFENLKIQMKDTQKFKIDKIVSSDTVKKLKNYRNALEQAINLQKKDNSQKIKKAKEAEAVAIEKVAEAQKKLNNNTTKKSDLESEQTRLTAQIQKQTEAIEELAERRQKLAKISQNKRSGEQQAEYTAVKTDYETAEKALSRYKNELKKVEEEITKNALAHTNLSTALQEAQEKQESARQKLEEAKNAAVVTEKELNDLKETIHSLGGGKIDALPNDLKELEKILLNLDLPKQVLKEINESMEKMAASGEAANGSLGQMESKASGAREMAEGFKEASTQVEQLKSRLTYFFSAMNGFQLFKNAIRDAYNSIKELDAAMTEMAVVTDYSISDIWGNIKQYTAEANELGATTKDVINSMVLYTQQGLEMSEATQLSTETMKMARIAGLEGAEATDLMTAALRGFNMELNNTSAQRVNDVYSNLAANAAANTQEIADAMTRTASIANAAGMEFETTAAFLTQMIETTRESAENLGTAMKTIVARFTEMKKSPNEIIDVDGEEVSANKVEAALKSVGVQLRDTNGEFRDLDDVFLDLSSKWDSLDKMSQRYVATTAAGSRQQSRFIAMMDNYQRTMELVGYATNSAGASQKQFDKTMDSLESKLNRLHNAWEQYVTGIADQSIIKGIVDLLTNLLTTINNITEALDPFHTGWSKILAAFLGFKTAKGIVNGVLKGIGNQLGTRSKTGLDEKQGAVDGSKYGKGFWGAFKKIRAQRKPETMPITEKAKSAKEAMKAKGMSTKKFTLTGRDTKAAKVFREQSGAMKEQNKVLNNLSKGYSDYSAQLSGVEKSNKAFRTSTQASRQKLIEMEKAYQQMDGISEEEIANSQRRVACLESETNTIGRNTGATKLQASANEMSTLAKETDTAATTANTSAKEADTVATTLEGRAIDAENISQQASNMTKGQALLGLFSLNREKRLAAAIALGLATSEEVEAMATEGATGAQTAFNAALYACPIMWIVAGVAALVAGIALLVGWLNKIEEDKRETEKARLEGITQATEDATKKAEEAKEAYDNLLENKNTYNKLREELNSLVEGSEAYIEKLEEQKKLIQEMIKNNPKLSAYVTYDIKGNPSISSQGLEIEEQRLKRVELNTELASTYSDVVDTWNTYLDNFKKGGSDGFVVAGKNLGLTRELDNAHITANEDQPGSYLVGSDDAGLSTEYFKYIGTAIANKTITRENKKGYTPLGTSGYYIEPKTYEKIKNVHATTGEEKNNFGDYFAAIVGNLSEDRYAIGGFDPEKGERSDRNYIVDESSIISAIQQVEQNSSELLKQTQDTMRYLYQTSALSVLEGTYGLDDITKNRMAASLANLEVSSGNFAEDVTSFSSDVQEKLDKYDLDTLKQKYEEIYGIFNEDELDLNVEDEDKKEEAIKGYLASAIVAQEKFSQKVEDALKNYYKAYIQYGDDFVAALELSNGQIDQFINKDLATMLLSSEDFDGLKEQGTLTKNNLEDMLGILGISSPEELQKVWKQTRANLIDALTKGYGMFGVSFEKILSKEAGGIKALPFDDVTNALKYSDLRTSWEGQIQDLSRTIGKNFSIDFDSIFGSLVDTSLFKDAKAAEETYKRISKINFTNPIQSAHEIKELVKDTNKDLSKLGKELDNRTKSVLSLTNQANYLYNSLGDKKEDLFEDGFVSKDEINELKKTLPDIKTMLDDNSLSASTLATYFNKVNDGMLNIIGTSSNFISALDKINKAENIISDSMDFVDELEIPESQQKITDSFSEWRDSMKQSLERGQYGDQNLQSYAKAILGLDNWDKYYKEFEGNLQKIEELAFEKINLWRDNFYDLWKDFAGKGSIASLGEDGSINFDLSQVKSIDDIIKTLMDTYGFSEDIAKAALADAQTYSSNLSEALKKLSITDSISELLQGSIQMKDATDGLTEIFVNKDQLQVLADEAGIEIDELITKIKENIDNNHKINVADLINEDGTLSESLEKSLSDQISGSIKNAIKGIEKGGGVGTINIGSYLEQLTKAGMDEDKAKQTITRIINQQLMREGQKGYGFDIKNGQLSIAIGFDNKKSAQKALNVTEYSDSLDDAFTKAGVSAWDSPEVAAARAKAMADAASQMTAAIAAGMYIGQNEKGINDETFNRIVEQSTEFSKRMSGWATIQQQLAQDAAKTGEVILGEMYTMDELISAYNTLISRNGWTGETDSGSSSEWENNYDDQYNILQKIEGLERKRAELERGYNKLLKQRYLDEKKLNQQKKQQIEVLQRQADINNQLMNDSLANMLANGNGDVWFDPDSGSLQTNPNAINYNEEQMKAYDKQLSFMQKWYETWKSSQENLDEIYDSIEELTKVAEFSTEDLAKNIESTIGVIDNTLTNLEREITRADRYDSHTTAQQLTKLYQQSMQSNTDKYNQLTQKKATYEQQLNGKIHSPYSEYYEYDWDTKQLKLTDAYYKITNTDVKDSVDEEIEKIDELSQTIIDIDNQQEEIKDAQYELKEALLDKRLEFEEKIYEAVVHNREEQIENLKNLDESIKNAASELISSVQKNLQKLRQDRQNAKTEEELQNMEARLAYLQVDTSNANQKSVLDLQKQLTDKQQSYTDSLIDQKITELQQQNDEAAAQRKKQIEIMEAQLNLDKVNGVIWQNVNKAILQGVDTTGKIQKDSELYVILSSLDEVTKKNATQFERWFGELSNLAAYYRVDYDEAVKSMGQTSDVLSDPDSMIGENSPYIQSLKNRLEQMNRDGSFNDLMWYDQEGQKMVYKYSHYYASSDAEARAYNNKVAEYQALVQELANARAFYDYNKDRGYYSAFKRTNKYDSGGLADYTGLAWLDGTPSSPELVLNRRDTENFIQLKDILADVMTRNSNSNKTNGDFYFEIHIDVDKISNDYDVDKIAERIKQQISNEARYRNVNTINMIR